MKRKMFYGGAILAIALASFLYACKKETESINPVTQKNEAGLADRWSFNGTKTLYSKDQETGVIYKMVLVDDGSGNVSIDRGTYITDKPDTIKTIHFVESGIPREKVETTMHVSGLEEQGYYYIPFKPDSELEAFRPDRAPFHLDYNCDARFCPPSTICYLMDWGESFFCGSSQCMSCWTAIRLVPGPWSPGKVLYGASGSVLIKANGMNVIH